MVDDSFNPSNEWAEIATRIDAKHHVKHGLFGKLPESIYVKRYWHRSLGWSVVLARHVDLMHPDGKWWLVLNAAGCRSTEQPEYGFADAQSAIAHASHLMRQQFQRAGRARHAPRWKHYSLDGLGLYAELLITLPQWPAAPLTITGSYPDGSLDRLIALERGDVVFFPAQVPESYSYTLSAAMRSGLPIVATDLGALPERLRGYAAATLVAPDAAAGALNDALLAAAAR
jgi:hypothetical protein